MNGPRQLANAIAWAAAILASAWLDAPSFFCLILLPCLAVVSLGMQGGQTCIQRSARS